MERSYWMFVQSPENFEVTRELGFTIHGLGPKYRRRAQRMKPGDRILFYVTRIRKWTATATISSHCFKSNTAVWAPNDSAKEYPYRVKLAPDIILEEPDYVDALILAPRLDYVKRWRPEDWPLAFFDKLHLFPQKDFRLIEGEIKRIVTNRRRGNSPRRAVRNRSAQSANVPPPVVSEK